MFFAIVCRFEAFWDSNFQPSSLFCVQSSNRAKDGDKSLAKETSKEPVTETLNNRVNKVSAVEHKDLNGENKKETLIIEKDPLFVPIESWKENNTQVMTNKS